MNQQIFDFAIRAGTEAASHGDPGTPDHDQHFITRFAELILNECIDVCEKGAETQTTSQGAAILIKQKFDIK